MKTTFLLLALSLLHAVYASGKCRYDCGSEYPNRFGYGNLGGWFGFSLPNFRRRGFTPFSSMDLCASPSVLDQTTHPVIIPQTNRFAMLCAEGVKIYQVIDGAVSLVLSYDVDYEGEAFLNTAYKAIVLSINNEVFLYDFENDELQLQDSIQSSTAVSAAGFATPDHLFAFFDGSVVIKERYKQKSQTVIDVPNANDIKYAVLGATGAVYFCNSNEIVQVTEEGVNVIDTSAHGLQCSGVLANTRESIVVSADIEGGSVLAEIDTGSFSTLDIFGTYNFTITGMSRDVSIDGSSELAAFLAVLSDSGVYVLIESSSIYPRGAVYSRFDSTSTTLSGNPTLSSFVNPIVFDSDKVISYTANHLVKFFPTDVVAGFEDYAVYDFLPNPLVFGKQVVALTTSAEAVIYIPCFRFTAGTTPPEGSCPFGELPDVEEEAYWMTLFSGAAAGFALPFLGTVLCQKMKYFGDEEDDDVEVELYSDDEEEDSEHEVEEEEDYLTPLPVSAK